MKKLIGVVLAVLLIVAARFGIERFLAQPGKCIQPCGEFGKCQPLRLELSLIHNKASARKTVMLWYKATLLNQSCFRVYFSADPFMESRPTSLSLAIEIFGPNNAEIKPLSEPRGGVILYQMDHEGYRKLKETGRLSDRSVIKLYPGQTLTTIGEVLQPYRVAFVEVADESGKGTAIVRVPVPVPSGAERPPAGYRGLGPFVFPTAGSYKISARYNGRPGLEKIYSRWEALNGAFKKIGYKLGVAPEWDFQDVESQAIAAITFEVLP